MRLRRIELPAFGCLRGFEADLAPGLNLFHGLNEAGKSTLQQAVLALLYGFYDRDRAHPDETARHERLRPWSGNEYCGRLEYEVSDGLALQVRRDFSSTDVPTQLIDLATGQDVTAQFGHGRHGNVQFARRHLGMSRAVFQSCAFISQGEIFEASRSASPREIGDAIAALADSARRDVSATNATQRLSELIARIGSDRARTAELPRARDHLSAAERELGELEEARREHADRAAEADRLQQRLAELEESIARSQVLLARAQTAEMEARLRELREAERSQREAESRLSKLKPFASVPAHLRDEVLTLRERRQQALGALGQAEPELARVEGSLDEDAHRQYDALQAEVGSLTPDRLQALGRLAFAPPPAPRGLSGALIAAAHAAGRLVVALVAGLIRLILRRRPAPENEPEAAPPKDATETTETLIPAEAAALLEKHRRFLTLRPAFESLTRLRSEKARAEAALSAIEGQLGGLLAAAEITADEFEPSIEAFLTACERRREYESALAAGDEAARGRRVLLHGRSPQELERQHRELDHRLRQLLERRPELRESESDETPEELSATLDGWRQERESAQLRHTRLKSELDQAFARHRARSEIEEDIARWRREVTRLERARAAAQLAKDTIEEAVTEVYRDFAPRVNQFLSQGVDFVTGGRYKNAFVDPSSLQISLEVPEIDRVQANPAVSHGTRTLIYVLMRIGLAQHMSSIGEPVPLVLDDPFVDIDSVRLPRLLEFLAHLSQERDIQILLFSKEDHTLRWFQDNTQEPQHRMLHLPSRNLETAAAAVEGRSL